MLRAMSWPPMERSKSGKLSRNGSVASVSKFLVGASELDFLQISSPKKGKRWAAGRLRLPFILKTLLGVSALLAFLAVAPWAVLCMFNASAGILNSPIVNPGRVMFVTAHPDDETVFFAPSLSGLSEQTNTEVFLLCFTTGEISLHHPPQTASTQRITSTINCKELSNTKISRCYGSRMCPIVEADSCMHWYFRGREYLFDHRKMVFAVWKNNATKLNRDSLNKIILLSYHDIMLSFQEFTFLIHVKDACSSNQNTTLDYVMEKE